MKIKSAEHCAEMQQMLSGIPSWIYAAGISVWVGVAVLFSVCSKWLEYEKAEIIPLHVSVGSDSSLIAETWVSNSCMKYMEESSNHKFFLFMSDNADSCMINTTIHHVVKERGYSQEVVKVKFIFYIDSLVLKQHIDLSRRHAMVLCCRKENLWRQIKQGFGKFH